MQLSSTCQSSLCECVCVCVCVFPYVFRMCFCMITEKEIDIGT